MNVIERLLGTESNDSEDHATKLLEGQHREVETLFKRLESAEVDEKRALVDELARKLVGHSAIEKEIFYKELLADDEDGIREAYEEHALVEGLLYRIVNTAVTDPTFPAKVTVLQELIEHHVEEEEDELFKKAKADLGDERLEE